MTDIEKIRAKFQRWNDPLNYNPYRTCELVEMAYLEAYQQGQRDLIEAMGEPVAWQISYPSEPDLGHWISEGKCSDLDSIPLYRLPEDTQK